MHPSTDSGFQAGMVSDGCYGGGSEAGGEVLGCGAKGNVDYAADWSKIWEFRRLGLKGGERGKEVGAASGDRGQPGDEVGK